MKKLFNTNNHSATIDTLLLVARLGIAVLMLTHGIPKMTMLFSGELVKFPPVLGLSAPVSLGLTVFAEVICSIFILVGFATRLATLPLIITMLVAVLVIHAADPIGVKESGLQYLLVYVLLLIGGSGKYSIDYLLGPKRIGFTGPNRIRAAY